MRLVPDPRNLLVNDSGADTLILLPFATHPLIFQEISRDFLTGAIDPGSWLSGLWYAAAGRRACHPARRHAGLSRGRSTASGHRGGGERAARSNPERNVSIAASAHCRRGQ